jgi:hypothetical protein
MALAFAMARRQRQPGFDRPLVERGGGGDPPHLAEPLIVEQLGVEAGQLA